MFKTFPTPVTMTGLPFSGHFPSQAFPMHQGISTIPMRSTMPSFFEGLPQSWMPAQNWMPARNQHFLPNNCSMTDLSMRNVWNTPVQPPVSNFALPMFSGVSEMGIGHSAQATLPSLGLTNPLQSFNNFRQLPMEFCNQPLISNIPVQPWMQSVIPSMGNEIGFGQAMGNTWNQIPVQQFGTTLDSVFPATSALLPRTFSNVGQTLMPNMPTLPLTQQFDPFLVNSPVTSIPGYSSINAQGSINPLSNVRYIDNDTETIIDCFLPGINAESSEVVAIGGEIRIRYPLNQVWPNMLNTEGAFSLPLPQLGDGSRIKAQAINDFLRITVPTAANVVNTIQKVRPAKIG